MEKEHSGIAIIIGTKAELIKCMPIMLELQKQKRRYWFIHTGQHPLGGACETFGIKKPDFIFYDGWMLGARRVSDESIFEAGLPALDTPEHIQFAKDINKKLSDYEPLWDMIEFMNVLFVPHYHISLKWRDQAEEILRAQGRGMSSEQIREFVYYFWRSVHPAIQIKNLAHDSTHTQQVTVIADDHSVREILTPLEAKTKYP